MENNDGHNILTLSFPFEKKVVKGNISLPFSKSESNRALMIAAYGEFPFEIENLSDADDTILLKKMLTSFTKGATDFDCNDAGTVARFMITFLAGRKGEWTLTGAQRLCQRPMGDLVNALRRRASSR